MALNSDNLIGLYIAFGAYFLSLCCAALVAYRRIHARDAALSQSGEETKHEVIEAHYLGNRSFGPLLTAGSLFASFFSGYTVVGVPNEAFNTGWNSMRWPCATIAIVSGFICTAGRIRKLGLIRGHQSPIDFMTDRYRSQVLRYTFLVVMLFPAIVYLTAQLVAIQNTFNSLFDIDPESPVAVVIIASSIVAFEWIGGLSSVALTDCIQGFIMVFCFIALPLIVVKNYVGWKDLDWESYPRPEFYQTPSGSEQWLFWNFIISLAGGFLQPHLIQRMYATESFRGLKVAYSVLTLGPWFTMISGIFLGTVGVQILADQGMDIDNISSPFASILEAVMDLGGFSYVVGSIAFTATLASIMSTADSVLIAISQMITTEVVAPMYPEISGKQLSWIGRASSLSAMSIGLLLTFFGGQNFGELILIQYGIGLQAVPLVLLGLFNSSKIFDCHPWSLSFAAITATLTVIVMQFTYYHRPVEDQPIPLNPGITGIVVNLATLCLMEFCRRLFLEKTNAEEGSKEGDDAASQFATPSWDTPKDVGKFGALPLTPNLIRGYMYGIREPATEPWFSLLALCLSVICTPITETDTPPLGDDGQLLWAPNVINGIPSWAFRIILALIVTTLVSFYAIWVIPNDLDGIGFVVADDTEDESSTNDAGSSKKELEDTVSSDFDSAFPEESCASKEADRIEQA